MSDYAAMRASGIRVDGEMLDRLTRACQRNPWLKVGGADFEPEGFCCEHDYPYYLERYDDREMLRQFFEHGNWGIRTAVQQGDLIFVNQVNGGDEWWTLKVVGDEMVPFESMSMRLIDQRGGFDDIMDRLLKASVADCKALNY